MGVSGSGKTTVGRELASALGWDFIDADDLHPAANIQKMKSGLALDDDDRWPWLDRIRDVIDQHLRADASLVVACSALKQSYRDKLGVTNTGSIRLVYLKGSQALLTARLRNRSGHFMPPSLLQSQLDLLEEPSSGALGVDIDQSTAAIVAAVRAYITPDPGERG
ncbi:MAG: gluconokinase [Gammaproteobacteria bacterium]|nr:gluconokinase [Gammaproteobacteria bacterium]